MNTMKTGMVSVIDRKKALGIYNERELDQLQQEVFDYNKEKDDRRWLWLLDMAIKATSLELDRIELNILHATVYGSTKRLEDYSTQRKRLEEDFKFLVALQDILNQKMSQDFAKDFGDYIRQTYGPTTTLKRKNDGK